MEDFVKQVEAKYKVDFLRDVSVMEDCLLIRLFGKYKPNVCFIVPALEDIWTGDELDIDVYVDGVFEGFSTGSFATTDNNVGVFTVDKDGEHIMLAVKRTGQETGDIIEGVDKSQIIWKRAARSNTGRFGKNYFVFPKSAIIDCEV
jgi:hypothetical protein